MKVVKKSVAELHVDPQNVRRHSKANLEAIGVSLTKFGQRRVAVIRSNGRIIAGNGMFEAALEVGINELWCHVVPDEWSDDEARAFAIADNRTAELADWDEAQLIENLQTLNSEELLNAAGYTAQDFDDLVRRFTGEGIGKPNPEDEWVDMPDYENKNAQSVYKTIVHFMTHEDADDFFRLLGKARAKFIYYPDAPPGGNDSRRVGQWELADE
jgi:hypothetical protein